MIRGFSHADFPLQLLLERKRQTLTVVLPSREVADTVGVIVERILGLDGLVDQVLVVDADSADGTAAVARAAGAEVVSEADLGGAGESATTGVAAALAEFGPLICEPDDVQFVKASYRRPFTAGDVVVPDGGGRVSQLTARPLLDAFYPDLAGLAQPLSGEVAAPRALLEQLPFATGYAVETAMLIDVRERVGAEAIVQCDLGERRNFHQPLPALRPMADEVLAVVCERLRREGRLHDGGPEGSIVHRPPFAELTAARP